MSSSLSISHCCGSCGPLKQPSQLQLQEGHILLALTTSSERNCERSCRSFSLKDAHIKARLAGPGLGCSSSRESASICKHEASERCCIIFLEISMASKDLYCVPESHLGVQNSGASAAQASRSEIRHWCRDSSCAEPACLVNALRSWKETKVSLFLPDGT